MVEIRIANEQNLRNFHVVFRNKKFTLVGTSYMNDLDQVAKILELPTHGGTPVLQGFLIRDPAYPDAVSVFAAKMDQSPTYLKPANYGIKIGNMGTNYALQNTINGIEFAKTMLIGYAYPILMYVTNKEGETTGKGGRCGIRISDCLTTEGDALLPLLQGYISKLSQLKVTFDFAKQYRMDVNIDYDTIVIPVDHNKPVKVAFEGGTYVNLPKDKNGFVDISAYNNTTVVGNPCTEINIADGVSGPIKPFIDGETLTKIIDDYNKTKTQEEKKPMKSFNTMFSKFGSDFAYSTKNFAMSMFGGLAVKTKAGNFVTFNKDTLEAMDVMDMTVDGFEDFIMIMPTQKLEDGDLFVKNGSVFAMIDSDTNEAYSFDEGTIVTLMTVKNAFGFNMYAKVFNIMGSMNMGATTGGMFGGMNPMMMMMMMNKDGGEGFDMKNMMMMSMMSGGMKF